MKNIILLFFASLLVGIACKSEKSQAEKDVWRQEASDVVDVAAIQLSRVLMGALEAGDVPYALEFCNEQAIPITDEVSNEFGLQLKRTALRYRNPANEPTSEERALMEYYASLDDFTMEIDTLISLPDGTLLYARPILLQGPCLQCHGTPGVDIQEEHYKLILEKYPTDKAIGFSAGDFRGIWVVRPDKKI